MSNRKKSISWLLYVAPVILISVLVVWAVSRPLPGERVISQGNQHIGSVDAPHTAYTTKPPTSGPHIGSIARWGVHTEQIADEIQIHNLEDGGVVVHYDPERVDQEGVDGLTDLVGKYSEQVILEPYVEMETAIALTAWGRIDRLDIIDETRIRAFIDAYKGVDHHSG